MRTRLFAVLASLAILLSLPVSYAQEPTLQLLVDDTVIIGIVTKTDGSPAADLSLLLQDSSHPQSAATILKTDAAGVFMVTGQALTEYRASAVVDGRTISATASTGEGPPAPFQWPPIYLTLGALLLLSLIPAHFLKREDA